jgi:hypothetical protein
VHLVWFLIGFSPTRLREEPFFEDDPHVDDELRRRAAQPGSHYSLRRVAKGPAGVGLVVQDVVLGAR